MARSNNTIYLKSQSGRTMSFEQFRQELAKLGTSEEMRFKEIRSMLKAEAKPTVMQARQDAYDQSQSPAVGRLRTASRRGATGLFYNLYNSINVYANKGTNKAYVVIGLRNEKKNPPGAYYAKWQLQGLREQTDKNGNKFAGFEAKEFIERAVNSTGILEEAQLKLQKHIQRRIKKLLR